MKTVDILMVRVYITESSNLLDKIINYLKNDAKIPGVSVFRAVSGFGDSGNHRASLIDLSLDLPLAVEFFDNDKNKIKNVLSYLSAIVKPEHIVVWEAKANI